MSGNERLVALDALNVLVVDDEPRLRELLGSVIPEMGFAVTTCRSAEEALRAMARQTHAIVVLDLQLPLMHGLDLFETIRQRWPNTAVIVLSGFGDLESARRAIRLNVVDFLAKPCHLSELEVALDRARRRLNAAFPAIDEPPSPDAPTLAEIERREIDEALARSNGNRTQAARQLGISRRTLHYRLKQYRAES